MHDKLSPKNILPKLCTINKLDKFIIESESDYKTSSNKLNSINPIRFDIENRINSFPSSPINYIDNFQQSEYGHN